MPACFCAFKFNDHHIGLVINRQQIDTPCPVGPLTELFGNHQTPGGDNCNIFSQSNLQLATLKHALSAETRGWNLAKRFILKVIDGHINKVNTNTKHPESIRLAGTERVCAAELY